MQVSSFFLHHELSKWRTARNFFLFRFSINCFLGEQPWVVLIVAWGIPWPHGGGVCKVIPCSLHNKIMFYVDYNLYTNVQLLVLLIHQADAGSKALVQVIRHCKGCYATRPVWNQPNNGCSVGSLVQNFWVSGKSKLTL